jgi:hypothetical protein
MGTMYPINCLRFQYRSKELKRLFSLFLLLSALYAANAQTSLSFSQISTSTEVMGPGRGAEQWQHIPWNNSSGGGVEVPGGNTTPGSNYYIRFAWKEIESDGTQGSYNWTVFDQRIQQAINAGQMFSFGIMPICDGCSVGQIPTYLHNLMQAQSSSLRDWYYSADGLWIPNWNSPPYLARYKALLQAVANHINTTSYNGIPYSKVIYYVDIRGYGNYGEWHCSPWYQSAPSNAMPTAATLDSLISYNLQAFPNYPNVILAGAFSNGASSFVPLQTTYYALTAKNNWGPIGWRRDQWGDPGTDVILSNNPNSYNSLQFSTQILNTYKNAPVVGEPLNTQSTVTSSCGSMYCDLPRQIQLYHTASFGNGNLPNASNTSLQSNIISSSRLAGYRIVLTGGSMTTTLGQNSTFNISFKWQNIGLAPSYENWTTTFELRNSSGGVVWSGNSSFKVKLFQPSGSATTVSDNFTLSGVSTGTYNLYLIIRDPNGYKKPFPLAITGRNSDGSYLLRSSVTVGASSSQALALTANAGSDQTIILPASTVTLSGSGSAGSISSYAWTEVSGPNTATIATPSSSSTTVSGLIQGSYVFKLSLNSGASTDQITVTVNASGSSSGSGSIFTATPAGVTKNDGRGIEVGVKFKSSVAGTITGIRFYKTSGNSGTHTGELYSSSGARLAQAVFSGETSTGWQQVSFTTPVSIAANTVYVAAYFSSSGYYVSTSGYFVSAVVNGSLTALADGTSGSNGVYSYATTPTFPTASYSQSNYWVDVIFKSGGTSVTASTQEVQTMAALPEITAATGSGELSYHLEQNYPNPTLQSTKINYGIPANGLVELALYDLQGRIVKVMVNETKAAGNYQYELNSAFLPKGIYFYRMSSGNFVATRKMLVQ